MNKFGATIGNTQDSGVVELKQGATDAMRDRWHVPVELQSLLLKDGDPDPNNFYTMWRSPDGSQQIAMTFTKTISTFTGQPNTTVQVKSNGNVPDAGLLDCVIASLTHAGEERIKEQQWGTPKKKLLMPSRSPSIPMGATKSEVLKALASSGGNELLSRSHHDISANFGGSSLPMRIHVLKEPEILESMQRLGATHRTRPRSF